MTNTSAASPRARQLALGTAPAVEATGCTGGAAIVDRFVGEDNRPLHAAWDWQSMPMTRAMLDAAAAIQSGGTDLIAEIEG